MTINNRTATIGSDAANIENCGQATSTGHEPAQNGSGNPTKGYAPPLPDVDELSYLEFDCPGTPAAMIPPAYVKEEAYRQEIERKRREQGAAANQSAADGRIASAQARLAMITRKNFRPLAAKMAHAFDPRRDASGNVMLDAFGIPIPSPLFRAIPYKGGIEDLSFLIKKKKPEEEKSEGDPTK